MTGFVVHNPASPSPVILSVPHAGRDYRGYTDLLRGAVKDWQVFEDRHVDQLARHAIAAGVPAIVATTARAIVDFNRSERDLDPLMVAGATGGERSPRARAGLGLIPRHSVTGALWRARLHPDDVAARVALYRRYRATLASMIASARQRNGAAVLIDLHSMPPPPGNVDAVVSDCHGATAARAVREAVAGVLRDAGLNVAINAPYAGGDIVAGHGTPAAAIDALQLEFSRALYLDDAGEVIAAQVTRLGDVVARLVDVLADAARPAAMLAAE